jgi:hypothetical protein
MIINTIFQEALCVPLYLQFRTTLLAWVGREKSEGYSSGDVELKASLNTSLALSLYQQVHREENTDCEVGTLCWLVRPNKDCNF